MKIKGKNSLIFEVPDSVATGMVTAGDAELVTEKATRKSSQTDGK